MKARWIRKRVARMDDVLGTDVHCDDHGRIGWVRSSLANALIAAHVQTHHVLEEGGLNTRVIPPPVSEAD